MPKTCGVNSAGSQKRHGVLILIFHSVKTSHSFSEEPEQADREYMILPNRKMILTTLMLLKKHREQLHVKGSGGLQINTF